MCGQHVLLPRHGLKAGGVTSASLGEKISPISSAISKWQIGLGQRHKPFLGGTARAVGGMIMPPNGVQGRSPGTPLVPFVVKRKEPRVWAGQAHWWVLGLPAP